MNALVGTVRSLVAPLTRTRAFRAAAPRLMPLVERRLAMLTRGRVQLSSLLVPSLTLFSVGARSGDVRQAVLMYTPDGRGNALIAGTSFARDAHPGWTFNLRADPGAVILVRGRLFVVEASELGAEDREQAWVRIEGQWPGYRAYERESGRTVRIFGLRLVRELQEPTSRHDMHGPDLLSGKAKGERPYR